MSSNSWMKYIMLMNVDRKLMNLDGCSVDESGRD